MKKDDGARRPGPPRKKVAQERERSHLHPELQGEDLKGSRSVREFASWSPLAAWIRAASLERRQKPDWSGLRGALRPAVAKP